VITLAFLLLYWIMVLQLLCVDPVDRIAGAQKIMIVLVP
jgi:hypothetical protein